MDLPPAPPGGDEDLWPMLIEFALGLRTWWIELCAELDLTPSQGHALRNLDPDRPVAMSALAEEMLCDASNVTGIVDKLESRGLIARQGAEHDRRMKMLLVTGSGREIRSRLISRMAVPPASVARLPSDAKRWLAATLRGVLQDRKQ